MRALRGDAPAPGRAGEVEVEAGVGARPACPMYGYQATVPPAGHKPPELPPLQRDLRVRMEREPMVVPGPPPVDITTLREVRARR